MSDLTTVKVPVEVRDRFAVAARARGITVRALLDQLSRQAADEAVMEDVARQMERMRTSAPDAWADYLAEGDAWEVGTIEPLDS